MLRLSSHRVEYCIDGGHGILELCSPVVHDGLGPEAANIVDIARSSGCENLQFGLLRELHRIRANISSSSVY